MKSLIKKIVRTFGFDIVKYQKDSIVPLLDEFPELSQQERDILNSATQYTMTSVDRMVSLIHAIKFIIDNNIQGDIVECGVWRGGSMMIVAKMLLMHGETNRIIYLYDTFEGMSEPTDNDVSLDGEFAASQLQRTPKGQGVWCEASIEDVRANMISTGYPAEKIRLIKGKVEDTIPAVLPGPIALLRLDTDWYESTRHEMINLFPLLQSNGVLIIDDYGHWQGSKKAIDEYFSENGIMAYLHRVDYTGRIFIK